MQTIEEIRAACEIDEDGHWIWTGAVQNGMPKIWAPDFTNLNGALTSQLGRRAVWHIVKRQAIPKRWRVYSTCNISRCLNPQCLACGPTSEWGQHRADSDVLKGNVRVVIAGRLTGRSRSVLSADLIERIQLSPETGRALAAALDISTTTVSRARRGQTPAFQPIGGFTALGGRQ